MRREARPLNTRERPNIIQFICHDLDRHLGCLGAGVRTPHLDALASQGVLFDTYCCPAASCSPSRGSIMTGRYPHRNGLIGLAHLGWKLHDEERCLPHCLNEAEYETHLFGVQHESARPERLGYQQIHNGDGRAEAVSASVAGFLRQRGAGSAPFYVSAGTFEPHRPYEQEGYAGDDPDEVQPLPWLPDRPGIRADIADLNGLVKAVDKAVGTICQALDEAGLAASTVLVFTTDHGLAMPRAKGTCYDPGLKTALIMRWPGRFAAGRRESALLTNCDFLPTILELAGAPPAEGLDGRSFAALLQGWPYEPRDHVFCEMTWHDQYNPMRAIRTPRHKYIRNFGRRPLVYLPLDVWQGRAGREVREEYYGSVRPAEELYDLQHDPGERRNLTLEPTADQAATLRELRERVQRWMEETDDPLLGGDVPPTPEQEAAIRQWGEAN